MKFHSIPVYDQKYWKGKIKEFAGVIKTNFLAKKIPKENKHYSCIVCITIDSVMRIEKKKYPHVFLEEYKYKVKKAKMTRFTNTELELESEPEPKSKSDAELITS